MTTKGAVCSKRDISKTIDPRIAKSVVEHPEVLGLEIVQMKRMTIIGTRGLRASRHATVSTQFDK